MSGLIIGKIVKAQGIKGEVKVLPITDDVLRFSNLKRVFIDDNQELKVENVRIDKDMAYVKFFNVNTRNDAETLINKFLTVPRVDANQLPEGRYFIVDLIGCTIMSDDKIIGVLCDILQHGCADVYVVDNNGQSMMFPALKDVILDTDIINKIIKVDGKRLKEVAVYA